MIANSLMSEGWIRNGIAPKGFPCGATERAPESSGTYFWKRRLSTCAVESLGVDSSLAENQVLGASEYSVPIILVMARV